MSIGKDAYRGYQAAGKEAGVFPLPSGMRVLEIGFGTGALLEALRARGNEVYGADAAENLVQAARDRGFDNVIHLDISEEPLPWPDDFFDAVFAYEVFEHLTNPHRLFYEVRRTLKRDHDFYFSVPCQEVDMGYGLGLHPFVYPGLLLREHLERFIMQMYFRIDEYHESTRTLEGRSYRLANKKHPSRPDIVYVVPKASNVRDLYEEVLPPDKLRMEIEHEVRHLLHLATAHAANRDLSQVLLVFRHCTEQYPDFYPMYPEFARLLGQLGQVGPARGMLEVVFRRSGEIPDEVLARAHQIKQQLETPL